MADDTGEINWYMPEVRTIIPLENFNTPRSLKKFMEKSDWEYKYSHNPLRIIRKCADRESTWISDELINAYKNLINLGNLNSVEVYEGQKLIGGLYGVTIRGAFFGESMFSSKSQASKTALIKLIQRLNARGFSLLDVQYQTEHLKMFGATEISFREFSGLLEKAYSNEVNFI